MPKLRYCVTLRSGGDYDIEDVHALVMQAKKYLTVPHEFVCFTDTPINHPMVTEIPLESDWPGFWSILEVYRNEGPTIMTGLDTVIFDNIDPLGETALTCSKDQIFMCRPRIQYMINLGFWASGIMVWNGDWSWILDHFDYAKASRKWKWEQMFVSNLLIKKGITPDIIQDRIPGWYSYKMLWNRNNRRPIEKPKNISIMTFAGNPRPKKCKEPWIREARDLYKTWEYTIPMEGLANEARESAEEDERVSPDMLNIEPKDGLDDIRDWKEYPDEAGSE